MLADIAPVPSDEKLPERADVVIIGGGIIGASLALFLAERKVSVVLCEKGIIAGEQSSRNWGWCRQMGRDPREIPLIIESLGLWRQMNERIGEETGFRTTGILYLAKTDQDLEGHQAWMKHARAYQLDSQIIDGKRVAELIPQSATSWKGALYTPSDGKGEPFIAAPAIARGAQKQGAKIFTRCAVRGIEREGGRISGVVTEKGRIACSQVVLAGGAWSGVFCRSLGLRLPQLKVLSSVLRTTPVDGPVPSAWAPGFAYRKRADGGYTVAHGDVTVPELVPDSFRFFFDYLPMLKMEWKSLRPRLSERFMEEWNTPKSWALDKESPFERIRTFDPKPLPHVLDDAMKHLRAAFPLFDSVKVADSWAGYIDAMPDAVPVISPIDQIPGFFVATGFSGHGFGIGPGAGRLMADLVTGSTPIVDPTPFRFTRFSDGTKIAPSTGV
ncbi:NAD(P)/FAD-dependent oxidoreductase [Rhodoligotrophos appendicifer]|uniref:NAD(P)/FAD-dependent oxidoreductase n=1 Tax=Rhodoligotrophos appendicifer TaxID=987056 RepID=UPI00117C35E7|nr:FAD-binding oxidoreductase [Rhodoligotrophos appendicifer]